MARMGGADTGHHRAIVRPLEPARKLSPDAAAKHAAAFEARALAGDDQDQAQILSCRVGQEPRYRLFGGH